MDYWKARSGQYAGYRRDDKFYSSRGEHIGNFNGSNLYCSKTGRCIAVVVRDKYLGKASSGTSIGSSCSGYSGARTQGNISGAGTTHEDPDF
jgi:hypothetical protein